MLSTDPLKGQGETLTATEIWPQTFNLLEDGLCHQLREGQLARSQRSLPHKAASSSQLSVLKVLLEGSGPAPSLQLSGTHLPAAASSVKPQPNQKHRNSRALEDRRRPRSSNANRRRPRKIQTSRTEPLIGGILTNTSGGWARLFPMTTAGIGLLLATFALIDS